MSWHFSRALVEEFSEATCSDGAQSAQLSESPTPQAYLCSDRMTAFSRLSRFGMTFAPLTEDLGADLLTWFLADSRVRTYQLPGMVPALTENDQASGEKWRESSVRYDLDLSSWKIHLSLFPEDLQWSSVTLPKWGMTRNGAVYQHPTAERPISATASGLWPTPVASDTSSRTKPYAQGGTPLSLAANTWPTPRSCSAMAATITPESAWKENRFPNLETVVGRRMWPTPNATDGSKWNNQSLADRKAKGQQIRLNTAVSPAGGMGGQLNPMWVEWLMGWPLGWTDLKPLEMARFQEWQQQHSPTYHKD